MKQAVVRNGALLVGLGLAGAASVMAAPYLASPRGALGPTVLLAESRFAAATALLICLALATLVAAIVSRLVNAAVGLFVLGGGVYALAGRMATIGEVAMLSTLSGGKGNLLLLAIETLLWSGLVLAASWAAFAAGGPLADVHSEEGGQPPHPVASRQAMKAALAGALMLPMVWLIAQSPMKGQMIGATFLGGTVAGLAGRLLSPHVQPLLLFASPIVFGALGHLIGMGLLKTPLDVAWVSGKLPALSLPMPIDYAAGSLMGVAVGVGWARSFLHHEEHATAPT